MRQYLGLTVMLQSFAIIIVFYVFALLCLSSLLIRAWLWDDDPKIKVISQRVKDCTGLETELRNSLSSSEPFQVCFTLQYKPEKK